MNNLCIIELTSAYKQDMLVMNTHGISWAYYTPYTTKLLGGILVSLRPSVCLSVRPSRIPCPLCSIYSSGWILSIFGTNGQWHERVCRIWWPLTLTYIFKVIWPWLRKSCPLCSVYSFGWILFIPPTQQSCWGVYWFHSVRPSICPSSRVRSVASTVQDGSFPYLVQMINGMRGCLACDDPWPWPISSRSFGLDLENHVRSVASTVLDGFFLYLAKMITIIRGCVACCVFFRIWKFEFLANF